jgi:hypothetical protein
MRHAVAAVVCVVIRSPDQSHDRPQGFRNLERRDVELFLGNQI